MGNQLGYFSLKAIYQGTYGIAFTSDMLSDFIYRQYIKAIYGKSIRVLFSSLLYSDFIQAIY
jgi:hypothetical protein